MAFDRIASFGNKRNISVSDMSELLAYVTDTRSKMYTLPEAAIAEMRESVTRTLQTRFGLDDIDCQRAVQLVFGDMDGAVSEPKSAEIPKSKLSEKAKDFLITISKDDSIIDAVCTGTWEHLPEFVEALGDETIRIANDLSVVKTNPRYRDSNGNLRMHIMLYELFLSAGIRSKHLNDIISRVQTCTHPCDGNCVVCSKFSA